MNGAGYSSRIGAAIALLAGCGGSQPPIAAPGAMPQSRAVSHADRGGSWMGRGPRHDLVYVSNVIDSSVYVYTYPQGHLEVALTGFISPYEECVDSAGDVFIVDSMNKSSRGSTIYEYAHGGTTPIAILSDPSTAFGCAIDPKTGDLAASGDGVAIFKNASGEPTMHYWSESV